MINLFPVSKEIIVVGSDHRDKNGKVQNAVIKYLEKRGVKVVRLLHFDHERDNYVQMATETVFALKSSRILYGDNAPQCAILFDQHGSGCASVLNGEGIVAGVLVSPSAAYDINRKNRIQAACIPLEIEDITTRKLVKTPIPYILDIVQVFLDTELWQDMTEEEKRAHERREILNKRIHDIIPIRGRK